MKKHATPRVGTHIFISMYGHMRGMWNHQSGITAMEAEIEVSDETNEPTGPEYTIRFIIFRDDPLATVIRLDVPD